MHAESIAEYFLGAFCNTFDLHKGSLMQAESIGECSLGAFCNTFGLHKAIIGLENEVLVFFEWLLKTGFIVYIVQYLVTAWDIKLICICPRRFEPGYEDSGQDLDLYPHPSSPWIRPHERLFEAFVHMR